MKAVLLKGEEAEIAGWKKRAAGAGMSLSAWIRMKCAEESSPLPVRGPGPTSHFPPIIEELISSSSNAELVEHVATGEEIDPLPAEAKKKLVLKPGRRKVAPSTKKLKRAAAAETARASVQIPQRKGEMVDVHMPTPDFAARCKHHHGYGEVCYKCDPKFGVPEMIHETPTPPQT